MSRPNYNPANKNSLSGVIEEVLKNFGLQLENCMPAIVKSYDRANNIVSVQPAINIITTENESFSRDIIKLPVFSFGGGGIVIQSPLVEGNTGWIIAGDRDISLFKQSLSVSNPNTFRTHKLSFGFFIPDKVKGISVSDSDCMVIQTLDGSTAITLKDGEIKIKTSGNLTAEANNATITASGNVSITSPTTNITGNLVVSGTITGSDCLAGTISLLTHIHSGGTISGKTGAPE